MDIFKTALDLILKHEGGYVNHPEDPGGETKYGISKRAYPDVDIKNLTPEQAGEIYYKDYWCKVQCDSLPEPVALMVFDAAVNMGVRRAAKQLQKAASATPDGVVGPMTIKAVRDAYRTSEEDFLQALYDKRQSFYERLKTFKTFGRGWTRRNKETLEEATRWKVKTS
jgi:lysozyme family protein